jgi:hypothetical protein
LSTFAQATIAPSCDDPATMRTMSAGFGMNCPESGFEKCRRNAASTAPMSYGLSASHHTADTDSETGLP